ncbi:hypothetical protein LLE49_25010 [Alicyclobacillus tolerans]|uniref:hypothetical protein n=1 Tax=Alicyclobacillus tolerans TaxID=90970 RepID=UPI001F254585|nr:hypothetical protein [Alicyclobacillus tolerans]MCF8567988.1 hypothetical protein [Alicyclobacillus tolerans]
MIQRRKNRYVILDLGEKVPVDELLKNNPFTALALEVHRDNRFNPYSRYPIQRVLPCRFERGKLYKT